MPDPVIQLEPALAGTLQSTIPGNGVIASTPEALAGSSDVVIMTPLKVNQALSAAAFTFAPIAQAVPLSTDGAGYVLGKLSADPYNFGWVLASTGSVVSVSIETANGFAGISDGDPANPVVTLSTTVTGFLIGDGTEVTGVAATGTGDVVRATSPTLVTPVIGAATGTSLSVTGAISSSGGVLTISGTGTSTIAGPLSIAGASAGQIVFPSSANLSSNANTLDDYREVTSTLTLAFATPGTSSWVYTTRTLYTTKIGNSVTFVMDVDATPTIGTGAGILAITGNPYAAITRIAGTISNLNNAWVWPASRTMVAIATSGAVAQLRLNSYGSAQGVSSMQAVNMTTGVSHLLAGSGSFLV